MHPHDTQEAVSTAWQLEVGGRFQPVDEATMRAYSKRMARFNSQPEAAESVINQMWAEIDRLRTGAASGPG